MLHVKHTKYYKYQRLNDVKVIWKEISALIKLLMVEHVEYVQSP